MLVMDVTFMRAVANIPASAAVMWIGLVLAWVIDQPKWAAVKAVVVGPFLALAALPFLLFLHLLIALAGIVASRIGLPGRTAAIIAAVVLALILNREPLDPSTWGDPTIARFAFMAALVIPWLFVRPKLWPWRGST